MHVSEKIAIGGIKFSGNLVQVSIQYTPAREDPGQALLALLAELQINLALVTWALHGATAQLSGCVAMRDWGKLETALAKHSRLAQRVTCRLELGALALFPHRARMSILGRTLVAFGDAGIPIYGLASSISAIVCVIPCRLLEKAAIVLEDYFILPAHHAPFKPEFCVRQVAP